MSDLEFDRLIKSEFSALTLDKLRMLSEGAMFTYADLYKVYLLGKQSLRTEIEWKDGSQLRFAAAHDADRAGELYDSFDGELFDMAQQALSTEEESDE